MAVLRWPLSLGRWVLPFQDGLQTTLKANVTPLQRVCSVSRIPASRQFNHFLQLGLLALYVRLFLGHHCWVVIIRISPSTPTSLLSLLLSLFSCFFSLLMLLERAGMSEWLCGCLAVSWGQLSTCMTSLFCLPSVHLWFQLAYFHCGDMSSLFSNDELPSVDMLMLVLLEGKRGLSTKGCNSDFLMCMLQKQNEMCSPEEFLTTSCLSFSARRSKDITYNIP